MLSLKATRTVSLIMRGILGARIFIFHEHLDYLWLDVFGYHSLSVLVVLYDARSWSIMFIGRLVGTWYEGAE
jgi:hypothetical protein